MRKALSFGLVLLAWFGALTTPARAQEIAQSFSELRLLIREGDRVTVTRTTGDAVTGRVESLNATSLVLARDGRLQTWSEADVVSIRQRRGDSPGFTALAAGVYGAAGPESVQASTRSSPVSTSSSSADAARPSRCTSRPCWGAGLVASA